MNINLIISGRVQGVGFRYSAQKEAKSLGLYGWVRNLPDGTVELEVEGDRDTVQKYMKKINSGFHVGIQVDNIKEKECTERTNEYSDFSIR